MVFPFIGKTADKVNSGLQGIGSSLRLTLCADPQEQLSGFAREDLAAFYTLTCVAEYKGGLQMENRNNRLCLAMTCFGHACHYSSGGTGADGKPQINGTCAACYTRASAGKFNQSLKSGPMPDALKDAARAFAKDWEPVGNPPISLEDLLGFKTDHSEEFGDPVPLLHSLRHAHGQAPGKEAKSQGKDDKELEKRSLVHFARHS